MRTKVIVCPICGEILEYSTEAWDAHLEKERRIWIDRAHKSFDAIWKTGIVDRTMAYSWLARELDIPYAEAHFSKFTIEQCKKSLSICELAKARMLEAFCKTQWGDLKLDSHSSHGKWGRPDLKTTGVDRCTPIT